MSRLSEMQIYAAIQSCRATAEKHERVGRLSLARDARKREGLLVRELRERIDFALAHDIQLGDTVKAAAAEVLGG